MGVFVDHDSYLESFEIACELHTLKQQIAEYVVEEALKEQEKLDKDEELAGREELILNPDTEFDARFEAVMLDLLDGKHSTQIKPAPGLHQQPEDNDSDDNPTTDY